jgi:hypothetical protein
VLGEQNMDKTLPLHCPWAGTKHFSLSLGSFSIKGEVRPAPVNLAFYIWSWWGKSRMCISEDAPRSVHLWVVRSHQPQTGHLSEPLSWESTPSGQKEYSVTPHLF